jgi:hypothetical protein
MKQLKKQVLEKEITSRFQSNLLDFISFNKIKHLSKRFFILLLFGIIGLFGTTISTSESAGSVDMNMDNVNNLEQSTYITNIKKKTNSKLILEVDRYIKKVSPKSELKSEQLVLLCREYQMDLVFVIAQGIIESHLGTAGKAIITKSVWNVGAYDNGVIANKYNNPNESIKPYLKLLKDKYLIQITRKGDTIQKKIDFLLKDRGYVNCYGRRFATSLDYESQLRNMMLKVSMETSIPLYQGILYMKDEELLDFFVPSEANKNKNDLAQLE